LMVIFLCVGMGRETQAEEENPTFEAQVETEQEVGEKKKPTFESVLKKIMKEEDEDLKQTLDGMKAKQDEMDKVNDKLNFERIDAAFSVGSVINPALPDLSSLPLFQETGVIYPSFVPLPLVDSISFVLVDLTEGPTHDLVSKKLEKVLEAVNSQLMQDFMRVWGIMGAVMHDKDIDEQIKIGLAILDLTSDVDNDYQRDMRFRNLAPYFNALDTDKIFNMTGVVYLLNYDVGNLHHHIIAPDPLTQNMIPSAYVYVMDASDDWTIDLSHEVMEMLAAPLSAYVYNPNFSSDAPNTPQAWKLEVCSPVDDISYEINGVNVSDFITPHYYSEDYRGAVDFRGYLKTPLSVLEGGEAVYFEPGSYSANQITWYSGQYSGETQPTLHAYGH